MITTALLVLISAQDTPATQPSRAARPSILEVDAQSPVKKSEEIASEIIESLEGEILRMKPIPAFQGSQLSQASPLQKDK